ncbi:serine/arginine-rich splicing factor SR34A [Dendrobium catenatum]|uniref:Pre-mRNA-splicing factor SF2 n=1 Tax=Dendrobium catenatum TaxID=906689 RepID=A0A2I0WRL6_9ASPA|nr:serine/arginine-rich splicing factor SR34A [Dendrobium catenatum]XP_028551297.1 serine/arginine-rich splicing factor SR34A [Dendrobium catenatum]PKU78308.1 Pre-mRNA-splicing factor SF2 [Dendrobium catenatum]
MSGRAGCTIYVGNLPIDVRQHEIEDLFLKYGHIVRVELKAPPRKRGYCFIEFESSLDAEDAIKGRNRYEFAGCHLKVEPAREGGRFSSFVDQSSRYGASYRSEYRVVVSGLPSSASWRDLKDYMRKAGDVCFAEVFQNVHGAMGIVHYTSYDDMKYAVCKLDRTEFRNPFAKSYIRVKISEGSMSRRANRSTTPRRSRSRSRRRRSVSRRVHHGTSRPQHASCFPNNKR